MKNLKRIIFSLSVALVAVVLVACGSKAASDNGTYVFKPDVKEFYKNTVGLDMPDGMDAKVSIEIEISDKTGKMSIVASAAGEKKNESIDLIVDQKNKTFEPKEQKGEKVKYKIEGENLMLDSSLSGMPDFLKDAKFKKQK